MTDAPENVKKTYNNGWATPPPTICNNAWPATLIEWQDEEYQAFCKALNEVNTRSTPDCCRRRRRNRWLPALPSPARGS
ncbi:MAG: hypothetical protein ACLT4C_05305 [Butyricicoccus sp.]